MNASPFDPIESAPLPEPTLAPSSGAIEAMERAQIDMQIATAKRYPRNVAKVKEEIAAFACLDDETANSCFYTLRRGDKVIQGPSVRLAEIAFSCWGNIRAGTRIATTVTDGPMPHVVVQSVAHDLEKNTCITMEKRRRVFKKKKAAAPDEDDVNLATNACSSIAMRDAILRVIPKTIINPACAAAMRKAIGDPKSLVAKRASVVGRLKQMGVSEERILAAVGRATVDEIDQDNLGTLIGFGTAIRDGEMTIEDAFPVIAPAPKKPSFKDGPAEPPDDIPFDQPPAKPAIPTKPQAPPKPMVPPEPPEASGPVLSPAHAELEAFLAEHGIGFGALQTWAVETGWEPGWDTYGSLAEVPARSVARLLRSKAGLAKQFAVKAAA